VTASSVADDSNTLPSVIASSVADDSNTGDLHPEKARPPDHGHGHPDAHPV
jgi:hypothetical protein